MSVNRSLSPLTFPIELPLLADPVLRLPNLWMIEKNKLSLFRLDIVFNKAGINQSQPIKLHSILSDLLLSGTEKQSALELNDSLDLYGAYVSSGSSYFKSTLTVFGLKKYFKEIVALISDAVHHSVFPEEEISLLLQQRVENLRIQKKKTSYAVQEKINSLWFDKSSQLTHITSESDYTSIQREALLSAFKDNFKDYELFYTGSELTNTELSILEEHFNLQQTKKEETLLSPLTLKEVDTATLHFVPMSDSNQGTCISRLPYVGRISTQFASAAMLQLIFGGYFGSRLMKNIREEKGWTYGIMSQIKTYGPDCSFLQIYADIKEDKAVEVHAEIVKEMDTLRNERVSYEELERAKNYYLGNLGEMYESSTALIDRHLTLTEEGLSLSWYNQFVENIKKVTPEEIQQTAKLFLNKESLLYSWAGPQ